MNNSQDCRPTLEARSETIGKVDVTQVLLAKREALREQLKQINASICRVQEEYDEKLEELHSKKKPAEEALGHIEALLKLEGWAANDGGSGAGNESKTIEAGTVSVTEAAYSLLGETQRPMHYKEIAMKLQEKQVYITGKDPAATLLSKISRDKRFKRTSKRGTYTLVLSRGEVHDPRVRRSRRSRKR